MPSSPARSGGGIQQLQSLDVYRIVCGADSYERLGEYYLAQCRGVPDDVKPYVDLAQVGKHYTVLHPGRFLNGCYVAYPDITPTPTYQGQGAPLPNDGNWTVKMKIASPSLPEGVWMGLPGPAGRPVHPARSGRSHGAVQRCGGTDPGRPQSG